MTPPVSATRWCGLLLPALVILVTACASTPSAPAVPTTPACWFAVHADGGERRPDVTFRAAPLRTQRIRNQRWCDAIGPTVVRDLRLRGGVPVADSILVVTWNIHAGGSDLIRFLRDLESGVLTAGTPPDAFVLLLQEAYRSQSVPGRSAALPELTEEERAASRIAPEHEGVRRVGVVELMSSRPDLAYVYAPSMRNGGAEDPAEDRGNAILSTQPLEGIRVAELPNERQRRVALSATLSGTTSSGTSWSLQATNVHLENLSRWSDFFRSFGKGRANQMRVLLAGLPPAPAAVIGGDFNTQWRQWNEKAIKLVHGRFPRPTVLPETPTYHKGWLNRRIDALMYSGEYGDLPTAAPLESAYGSDHRPVLGWIVFERDGETVSYPPPCPAGPVGTGATC